LDLFLPFFGILIFGGFLNLASKDFGFFFGILVFGTFL
jgi:hypothetical protein